MPMVTKMSLREWGNFEVSFLVKLELNNIASLVIIQGLLKK
jgi:hypothetical protein